MLILHPRCRHSLYAVDFQILTSFGVVPTSLNVIVSLSRLWLLQDETKAHFRCVRVVLFCDSVLFICSLLEWSDYDVVSPCLGPAAWLPRGRLTATSTYIVHDWSCMVRNVVLSAVNIQNCTEAQLLPDWEIVYCRVFWVQVV